MPALFKIYNGATPTTAAMAPVTTGTVIKTMLQYKPSATAVSRIVEWGVSFDGSAAATPGKVELIETDVAATVTAFVAADIVKINGDAIAYGDVTTNIIQVGTAASGFTATAEGTTTASRLLDYQLIAPITQFIYQSPLDFEAICQVSKFYRIRVTFGTAINCVCYMKIAV